MALGTPPRWDILTGEYVPQPGGVADYSRLVAGGLAARGCEVHVWAPPAPGEPEEAEREGVAVHRVAGRWSPADLARLGERLGPPGARRLLVQYTPNAWGYKSANVGFCRWLAARGRGGDHVRLMFHELFLYFKLFERPTRWVLPPVHRWMLRMVLSGCSRVDYATEEWGRLLRRYPAAGQRPLAWRPVPSNIPVVDDPAGVEAVRRRLAPGGEAVVGHFGTYSADSRARIIDAFPRLLLGRPDRVGLLIGHNGERFAAEVAARHPELAGRLVVTGGLGHADVSRHLQACDVLVQGYPGGVCARRGSLMAALAHGRPVASTRGSFTEDVFVTSGCAALGDEAEAPESLYRAAERLLSDPGERARVGASARRTYDEHFALERTVEALLEG